MTHRTAVKLIFNLRKNLHAAAVPAVQRVLRPCLDCPRFQPPPRKVKPAPPAPAQ